MNLEWLPTFYIVGGLMALAIAIVAFPTIWEQAQKNIGKSRRPVKTSH